MTDHANFIKLDSNHESNINLHKMISVFLHNWWLYVLFITFFIIGSYLYIRYATPYYMIHAKILVQDKKKGGNVMGAADFMQDLDLFQGQNSVDNEVELLKSRTLMEKTLDELQLNLKYFIEGKVKTSEVNSLILPFYVEAHNLIEDSISDQKITIEMLDNKSFQLKHLSSVKIYKFYDTLYFNFGKLIFKPATSYVKAESYPVIIRIIRKDVAVALLQQFLSVAPTNKTVSTIDLSISDPIPQRGENILNRLLFIYNRMNKDDKNRIADSTILFIDDRLKIVIKELESVEGQIQGFRQSNDLTDFSSQGKLLIENSSQYVKDLTQQEVQLEILNSLEDYLIKSDSSTRLVPVTLTIEEPTLLGLVQSYNTAQIEKDKLMQTTGANNPVMQQLNMEIPNLKRDILTNLSSIKRGMLINKNQISRKAQMLDKQMRQVPGKERTLLEYSRQQSIKEQLYLFLLQKREETAVSKSANVDNTRIVDSAKSESRPFKPQKTLIYFGAALLALLLPTLILYLKELLNRRILNKSDITNKTSVSIIGEIGHNILKEDIVVKEGSRTSIAEQFRAIRTNLQFLMPGENEKCILITSSMSGEGKSFIALNLASALALSGKRVVLMELDLRKPKISKMLGISNNIGFSNYAINKSKIEQIIIPSGFSENLWIIPSGPLPPNPSELIMMPSIDELFTTLKQRFDYIIIDTAPLGLVTDAQLLANYAVTSLYIVRQGYTFKEQLLLIDEARKDKKLPRLNIIVNDVKSSKGYGYGYGYGYGDVSNGYFGDEKKKKRIRVKKTLNKGEEN